MHNIRLLPLLTLGSAAYAANVAKRSTPPVFSSTTVVYSSSLAPVTDPIPTSTPPSTPPSCHTTYTSVPGDSCESLDVKFNLLPGTIKWANDFLTCSDIWTYTPICVPDGPYVPTIPVPPAACKETYFSTAGDTCSTIENKYNLNPGTIISANSFLNCDDIWVGTPVCVPDGPYKEPTTPPPSTCESTYISAAGDTCDSLDEKYWLVDGTILAANSFLNCSDIWAGTPICVPDGPYKPPVIVPVPDCLENYISKAGDTCATLDAHYGFIPGAILAKNSFLNCDDIWVGTPICVPYGPWP